MQYTWKKLSIDKVSELSRLELTEDLDFKILGSPVYLLLKKNEKLVSIKEPLDFFSKEERKKLIQQEAQLYVAPILKDSEEYFKMGRSIKEILLKGENKEDQLGISPFEVSFLLRKKLNQIWSRYKKDNDFITGIESFFIVFLIDGAFGNIQSKKLIPSKQIDFDLYEHSLMISSIFTFFLLHLSLTDLDYLLFLRESAFERILDEKEENLIKWTSEVENLFSWIQNKFPGNSSRIIVEDDLKDCKENGLQKIHSRLIHFQKNDLKEPASIYGKIGFNEVYILKGIVGSNHSESLSIEFLEGEDVN